MSVLYAQDSEYAKERTKWEAQGTELGPAGRPYVFRPYPMMLYVAAALPQGSIDIIEHRIAETELQRQRWEQEGFRTTPDEAIEHVKAQQREHAKLAAEREWEKINKLSPRAVAEITAVEQATPSRHLPVIEEQHVPAHQKKKGGWPKGLSRKAMAAQKAAGGEN